MNDVYIYDAIRSPRGRGKKDGSLHEVTAMALAARVLNQLRDRNNLDTREVDLLWCHGADAEGLGWGAVCQHFHIGVAILDVHKVVHIKGWLELMLEELGVLRTNAEHCH